MKPLLAVSAAALVLAVSACGSGSSDSGTGADAPQPTASSSSAAVPAPTGAVRTAGLVTVIDEGQGPEVCLGVVAMSYPPRCGGPAVQGWDWATSGQGMHEEQGSTRWGSYALTGTWDGTALTVDDAVPAALYDAAPASPSVPPAPIVTTGSSETLAEQVRAAVPDALGVSVLDGRVSLDVAFDDGSVQEWADATYGAGSVVVTSALLPA